MHINPYNLKTLPFLLNIEINTFAFNDAESIKSINMILRTKDNIIECLHLVASKKNIKQFLI